MRLRGLLNSGTVDKRFGVPPSTTSAGPRRRLGAIAFVASALVVAGLFVVAAPAQAANVAPAASGCRAAPYSATFSVELNGPDVTLPSTTGYYVTTSQCVDIQIKGTSGLAFQACVIFITKTSSCNYWTFIPSDPTWENIATDVLDGTHFRVKLSYVALEFGTASGVMDF